MEANEDVTMLKQLVCAMRKKNGTSIPFQVVEICMLQGCDTWNKAERDL